MKDKTIVVLESRAGAQLVESLARRGAKTLWAPALAELPDVDPAQIRALIDGWTALEPALVIFQTGVGTAALFRATDALGLTERLLGQLIGSQVAIRGPKPSGELSRRQVRVDRTAAAPFTTHELLHAVRDLPITGRTVLVQRYGESNPELLAGLRLRGALPREIATYRWALPADPGPLQAAIEAIVARRVDAVAFTSAVQARHLVQVAAGLGCEAALLAGLKATLVASIGPVCSATLRDLGASPDVEAIPPKLGPLVAALEAALGSPA